VSGACVRKRACAVATYITSPFGVSTLRGAVFEALLLPNEQADRRPDFLQRCAAAAVPACQLTLALLRPLLRPVTTVLLERAFGIL
jgi:hypothetical protein